MIKKSQQLKAVWLLDKTPCCHLSRLSEIHHLHPARKHAYVQVSYYRIQRLDDMAVKCYGGGAWQGEEPLTRGQPLHPGLIDFPLNTPSGAVSHLHISGLSHLVRRGYQHTASTQPRHPVASCRFSATASLRGTQGDLTLLTLPKHKPFKKYKRISIKFTTTTLALGL